MKQAPKRILTGAPLATLLVGLASAAMAGEVVYVPLGSAGELLAINGESDTVLDRFADLPNVHGLAATPDGKLLIAGSLAATTPEERRLPEKPAGMSRSDHQAHHAKPASKAAQPSGSVSFVSIVRAADGSIVRRVEVPGAVHHTAVTPDGRYAVATHPNGGGISVIDLGTFELTATLQTGPQPNYAVVSPDGKRVYVSNAGNNTISEVDTDLWIVRRNFLAGASPEHMALSHDGRRLYVANVVDGTVSEIATESGAITRTFEIGGILHGLDLSSNGRTLFVSARERNKLVAIGLHTGEMREASLAPSPYHLTTVRGAGKLYVSSAEESKIWVVDQESLQVVKEIPIRGQGHQMVVVQR